MSFSIEPETQGGLRLYQKLLYNQSNSQLGIKDLVVTTKLILVPELLHMRPLVHR
jgi:hypothetical protein